MSFSASHSWRRWLCGAALLTAALAAGAQTADPPARVAYISAQEGAAQLATDGGNWAAATLNWPITTGMRLSIDPGARTELQAGGSVIRLSGRADLGVTQLDDDTAQFALNEGTLSVRVRDLDPGERVEIDTPHVAVVATQPGEYRLDVDPRRDTTRLTVFSGAATVYGESGQSTPVGGRQQIVFAGRDLMVAARGAAPSRDGFDQWAATRDAQQNASASARFAGPDMPGVALLDQYGQWSQDATYGNVWYPTVSVSDWAPYRHGDWQWVDPWGWTWVDDAPWGFAPTHYGRWAQIGPRWAWVPGPVARRPVYAPAVVGFVGGGHGGASWGVTLGGGLPGAAWFPLAPGEYWEPHYRVSDRYRRRLNDGYGGRERRPPTDGYYFQRRPGAVTVAPNDRFGGDDRYRGRDRDGRRPRFTDGRGLPPDALASGRVVPPPPRAYAPGQSTQLPPPMPRPDAQGPNDPRRPRAGGDRGVNPPLPAARDNWQTPLPQAPRRPEGNPRERDRWLRDAPPPAAVVPPAPVPQIRPPGPEHRVREPQFSPPPRMPEGNPQWSRPERAPRPQAEPPPRAAPPMHMERDIARPAPRQAPPMHMERETARPAPRQAPPMHMERETARPQPRVSPDPRGGMRSPGNDRGNLTRQREENF